MVADLDQEVYVSVDDQVKGPNTSMSDKIQVTQPAFNYLEYEATVKDLVEHIIQLSGFALQTFGIQTLRTEADTTATEIEARERRTFLTRGRLIRTQTPHLARVVSKLLATDRAVFGTPNVDAPILVEFPDGVSESMLKLAQTVQTLFTAESASLLERVKILHPEWNDDMWDAEVTAIKTEFAQVADPLALPASLPSDPTGGTGEGGPDNL
jgi:hypothetical protein